MPLLVSSASHSLQPSLWVRAGAVVVAVSVVVALVIAPQAAVAVPAPSTGAVAGGTVVSDAFPAEMQFIAGDYASKYGLGSDGHLYAWGANAQGQLGDGTTTDRSTPVRVLMPAAVTDPTFTFTKITAGNLSAYGLGSDGHWYAWGINTYGQLGDGTRTTRSKPVRVLPPAAVTDPTFTFTEITADSFSAYGLGSDGHLYAWGHNLNGQLGDGTTTYRSKPVRVLTPAAVTDATFTFTEITADLQFAYGLGSDGHWYAWGYNYSGQLGDGTTTNQSTPVRMLTPAAVTDATFTFTEITTVSNSAYGLGSDDRWYAWGSNVLGQLGDGTTTNQSTPVPVLTPATASGPDFTFTEIATGNSSTYGLGSDGHLYAWGYNGYGQLGDGTKADRRAPVQVLMTDPDFTFAEITAGDFATYGLGSDGHWYAWGNNALGQLADGTTTNRWTPVRVLTPVTATDPGFNFAEITTRNRAVYGLGSDGRWYAWGYNINGQLGDGTTTNQLTPVAVAVAVAPVVVTGVSFDGVMGTGLVQADGRWSVVTPAATPGVCGPVDVVVFWTQLGQAKTTTVSDGFSYGAAPVVTVQPVSATIASGGSFTATLQTSGDPAPDIQWFQRNTDETWGTTPVATGASLNVSGLTATTSYRAAFTNCLTAAPVYSDMVTATVQAAPTAADGTATIGAGTSHTFDFSPVTTGTISSAAITVAPRFGTVIATAGTIVYTAPAVDPRAPRLTDDFTMTFTDDLGQTSQAHYTVTVTNLVAGIVSTSVQVGQMQTVTGTGFAPGEPVTAVMHSDPITVGSEPADAAGVVSFVWAIPVGTAAGEHTITLSGAISGGASTTFLVSASPTPTPTPSPTTPPTPSPITPATPASGAALASTGTTDPSGLIGIAIAVILLGAGLIAVRRRYSRG